MATNAPKSRSLVTKLLVVALLACTTTAASVSASPFETDASVVPQAIDLAGWLSPPSIVVTITAPEGLSLTNIDPGTVCLGGNSMAKGHVVEQSSDTMVVTFHAWDFHYLYEVLDPVDTPTWKEITITAEGEWDIHLVAKARVWLFDSEDFFRRLWRPRAWGGF